MVPEITHAVAGTTRLLLPKAEQDARAWTYHSVHVYFPADGHFSCPHDGALLNEAARNIYACLASISIGYFRAGLLAHLVTLCILLKATANLLSKVAPPSSSPAAV